jgi:hypothetical protein
LIRKKNLTLTKNTEKKRKRQKQVRDVTVNRGETRRTAAPLTWDKPKTQKKRKLKQLIPPSTGKNPIKSRINYLIDSKKIKESSNAQ